ncbi:diguanylate cyclase domain-containing protein [Roseateles sp. PN1]|uniref:diguanylate cyclase domain-containing protein n=1 Tax=Roseateles sp. PN1 TaxID=3137372 RepID=UPI003139C138
MLPLSATYAIQADQILRDAPIGIAVFDISGRFEVVNPSYCAIYGYSEEELLGNSLTLVFPVDQQQKVLSLHQKFLIDGGTLGGEWQVVRKDGAIRQVLTNSACVLGSDGQKRRLVYVTDITERKVAEDALMRQKEAYRAVADNGRALIWMAGVDKACFYFNQPWLNFTGRTEAQEYGNGWTEGLHPDDFQSCLDTYIAAFERREAFTMEYRLRRHDGAYRWIIDEGKPRYDGSGEFLGYVGHCLDIHERKEAEAKIQRERRQLYAILEELPVYVYLQAKDYSVRFANRLFRERFGSPNGRPCYQLMWQRDKPCEICPTFRVFETHKPELWEANRPHEGRTYQIFDYPFVDDEGENLVLELGIDVTERKQADEIINHLAHHDPLTQLPNRRLFNDRLKQAIAASQRSHHYGALMFLDLDNLKQLNDSEGHEVGDLLLVEVANRIKHCVRAVDTVARFGGDEFAVLINELVADKIDSTMQARNVAEKIRLALALPYQLDVQHQGLAATTVTHRCTVSIGIAMFVNNDARPDDIVNCADIAMYKAKKAGRNTIQIYAPDGLT